jgi:hypothetical protein
MKIIKDHIDLINQLCKKYRVNALFAFGSVVSGNFKPVSDIDLVVDIDSNDPLEYADNYFGLKFQLEKIFKRPVDLLEQKAIRNTFLRQEIDKHKVLVYGK